MNNRIKQLEPQCWEMNEFGLNFNYEKFADLIVRECIEAVRLVPYHSLDIDFDEEVIYQDAIRKHFGVEE